MDPDFTWVYIIAIVVWLGIIFLGSLSYVDIWTAVIILGSLGLTLAFWEG